MEQYDFSGWATRNDLLCGDGRTIRRNAFKDNDGATVPLIWNHDHVNQKAVIGHALLKNKDEGVYAYCKFNKTEEGQHAKELVANGDVRCLSIWANKLKQVGGDVVHGMIRELSLVLAGANPGAFIDFVMAHGDNEEDQLNASYDESALVIYHSDEPKKETDAEKSDKDDEDETKESPKEIWDSMNPKQQKLTQVLVAQALELEHSDDEDEDENDSEGGNNTMKHNIFDKGDQQDVLKHTDIINEAIADGKRFGSLKESVLHHAAANNITDIKELFPQEKTMNLPPEWIKDDDSWVAKVMRAVHNTPFSRVRALFAKMDETEARARGYIKGNMKKEIALAVLKRTTSPTTVYIKMKMDRDDIIDVDFDILAWQKAEMRKQLDRELAVAYLLGDGRDPSDDDKIDELCIRPVLTDDDMYTIKYTVTDGTDYKNDFNSASENDSEAKGIIRAAVKSRKGYKGSGNPTFFTTEDYLTELLLIEDQNGRRIYESANALATAMRVKEIVTVPEMESHTDIYGIIVNFNDYNTGTDKGGEITMFDDFDIDYNQQKFLMETRKSAALVKPYSAIVLKKESAAG